MRGSREFGLRAMLVLVSLVVTLAGLELAVRYRAYLSDRRILSERLLSGMAPEAYSSALLKDAIRLSEWPRVIYELKPTLRVYLTTTWEDDVTGRVVDVSTYPLRTDADGNRCLWSGCEGPEAGADVTIVGIGDSLMYGAGVDYADTYMGRLGGLLLEGAPGRSLRVLNMAAPGYNAVMEVELLKGRGLGYGPRVVVVGYCANDYNLPNFIRNERDYYSMRESFLYELVRERMGMLDEGGEGDNPTEFEYGDITLRDPSEVPGPYRDMVGWDAYEGAMRELAALGGEHGFGVVAMFHDYTNLENDARAKALARELGFRVVDMYPALEAHLKAGGYEKYRGSDLSVLPFDPHPSPKSHAMAAEALYGELMGSGLLGPGQ